MNNVGHTLEQTNVGLSNQLRWPTTAFSPWIGHAYIKGIQRKKILILGESHYHDCTKDANCNTPEGALENHQNLTYSAVARWKNQSHSSPLSWKVPALFNFKFQEKEKFWDSVAFYNFMQTGAGASAQCKRRKDIWNENNSVASFQAVLDVLLPDLVLVLGKGNWLNLPSNERMLRAKPRPESELQLLAKIGNKDSGDTVAYWYRHKAGDALFAPVFHPASAAFRVTEWEPEVRKFLKFRGQ